MQIYRDLSQLISQEPTALTIGTFDGIHRGHRRLIRSVIDAAHSTGRRSALVTFFPHPAVVLGRAEPFYLTSNEEKLDELEALGLDLVVIVEFTVQESHLHASQFVDLLVKNMNMQEMWIGYDFALGSKREGDAACLHEMAAERGFAFHKIEPVLLDGKPISSTRIRGALRAGAIREANTCLGRPFQIKGRVVESKRFAETPDLLIAKLGVWPEHAIPRDGMYLGHARIERMATRIDAVVEIATRPGQAKTERMVQVHLCGMRGNLHGRSMAIDLAESEQVTVSPENLRTIQAQSQVPSFQLTPYA